VIRVVLPGTPQHRENRVGCQERKGICRDHIHTESLAPQSCTAESEKKAGKKGDRVSERVRMATKRDAGYP